jgi:hypothetical protein
MSTLAIPNTMHIGYEDIVELVIPEKLKSVNEYNLKLPDKIEMSELKMEIVKKKQTIVAEIKEQNGRKQKSAIGKLF